MVSTAQAVAGESADRLIALCRDRTAVERVYYNHRLGKKPPFEQVSPPLLIERLLKEDLRKEAVLRRVYGLEVTGAMVNAEVQRINASTRAPEMLAEIKAALNNDPVKFANIFAKPILIEQLLRDKFDNDDALHGPNRRTIEAVRERLLAAQRSGRTVTDLLILLKEGRSNQVSEMIWQLSARPSERPDTATPDALEIKGRFGPDTQIISSLHREKDRKFYFEDLPPKLQTLLRVQLRHAGDVSAVVEMPGGYALYLAKEKTPETLTLAVLSIGKRSYEDWLAEQSDSTLPWQ